MFFASFVCFTKLPLSDSYKNNNDHFVESCVPIKSYPNADVLKSKILTENKKKSGIYRWVNNLNGKTYIGSSVNLAKRLTYYFNYTHISGKDKNMLIHKALIKYGYSNFTLEILEYVDPAQLIAREQSYFEKLKPEYNILQIAGSSWGFKHSEATKAKLKGRRLSPEHFTKLQKLNRIKAIKVQVLDTLTQSISVYDSIREAAKAIECTNPYIVKLLKKHKENVVNKPIKKRYIITKIEPMM